MAKLEPTLTPGFGFYLDSDGQWVVKKIPALVLKNAKFYGNLKINGYDSTVFITPDEQQWAQKSSSTFEDIVEVNPKQAMLKKIACRISSTLSDEIGENDWKSVANTGVSYYLSKASDLISVDDIKTLITDPNLIVWSKYWFTWFEAAVEEMRISYKYLNDKSFQKAVLMVLDKTLKSRVSALVSAKPMLLKNAFAVGLPDFIDIANMVLKKAKEWVNDHWKEIGHYKAYDVAKQLVWNETDKISALKHCMSFPSISYPIIDFESVNSEELWPTFSMKVTEELDTRMINL
jgi:hypothetical protein